MKYCVKCGNEATDEAVVCIKCGCVIENYMTGNKSKAIKSIAIAIMLFLVTTLSATNQIIRYAKLNLHVSAVWPMLVLPVLGYLVSIVIGILILTKRDDEKLGVFYVISTSYSLLTALTSLISVLY